MRTNRWSAVLIICAIALGAATSAEAKPKKKKAPIPVVFWDCAHIPRAYGTWRTVFTAKTLSKSVTLTDDEIHRDGLEMLFPEFKGKPAHCDYFMLCGVFQNQEISPSDPSIIKRTELNGLPAVLVRHDSVIQSDYDKGLRADAYRYLINTENHGSVQVMLRIGSNSDENLKVCREGVLGALDHVADGFQRVSPK